MWLFDVMDVYDDLSNMRPSEADLEDVVTSNDLDEDYEEKMMLHFEVFWFSSSLPI